MEVTPEAVTSLFSGVDGNGLWELVVLAGSLDVAVDAAIKAQEPAFVAKFAFQLAQAFNLFYHHHHILSETDEQKRAFLLRLTELVEAQLTRAMDLLGIEAPEKM
jgi:arginyl-tRNA synthetase